LNDSENSLDTNIRLRYIGSVLGIMVLIMVLVMVLRPSNPSI